MADQENENDLPQSAIVDTTTKQSFSVLKQGGLTAGKKAFEFANALAAPKEPDQATIQLPQLTESFQTAYKGGRAFTVTCCYVQGYLVEKNTAYDFILMANAAAKDGISLKIKSGFRTRAEQERLYNERKNPAVAKEKGVAAFPGTSNHQTGIAIDIDVGMKVSHYKNKEFTATYLWLAGDRELGGTKLGFAAEFGFDHVEGAKVHEPWHWTHLEPRIVGAQAFQSATGFSVLTTETAVNASASGQSGVRLLTNREGHDETVAWARGNTLPQMSRQTALKEQAVFSAYMSSYINNKGAQLDAATITLEQEPKAFEQATLNPLVYNFATGLWGDNKAV